MRHVCEFRRHVFGRLRAALVAEWPSDRGSIDRLDLRNEALVHAEDVIRVVAAEAEELQDVRDGAQEQRIMESLSHASAIRRI